MAVLNPSEASASVKRNHGGLKRYLPFLDWLVHYRRSDLTGDMMAGVIVAIMLVPQGMAYALLAGLPPQMGLYASILPLFIYGLLAAAASWPSARWQSSRCWWHPASHRSPTGTWRSTWRWPSPWLFWSASSRSGWASFGSAFWSTS